jgi:hypothetical protein
MENKQFFIKYLANQPIKVETHIDTQRKRREFPLTDVGDLIGAFQARQGSLLANTDSGLITLHLPEGVAKDSLDQDWFATVDETDTILRPGLVLSRLNGLALDDRSPLVIKSRNDMDGNSTYQRPPFMGTGSAYGIVGDSEATKHKYVGTVSRVKTSDSIGEKTPHVEKVVTFEKLVLEKLELLSKQNDSLSKENQAIAMSITPLVEDFIRRYYYTNDKATKAEKGDQFKKQLIQYYFNVHYAIHHVPCMFAQLELPYQVIVGAHLFKSCWAKDCEARLGFEDINNPRNGLLLFKPFEYAFDNSHICFEFDVQNNEFYMKILKPDLKDKTIRQYIQEENEIDRTFLLKSEDEWKLTLQKKQNLTQEVFENCMKSVKNLIHVLDHTLGDFEGLYLRQTNEKCFARCLSFQTSMARLLAIEKKWVTKEEVNSPTMFSELDDKKKDQLNAWFKSVEKQDYAIELVD